MLYEHLQYADPQFPCLCHHDRLEGRSVNAHWHESYEIICPTSGEAELLLDGRQVRAGVGQTAIIGSSVLHSIRPVAGACTYNCLLVDVKFLHDRGLSPDGACFDECSDNPALRDLVENILHESESTPPLYQMAVKADIDRLFVLLVRNHLRAAPESPSDSSAYSAVKRAMRFIHAHYGEPLTLDEICRSAGFAKNYFCRIFAEYAGQPPIRYLNRVRCEDARRMLTAGACNVTEAARRCGFSSLSHFSQVYRRTMGHSPSADIVEI